jgi:hypothetical protein
MSLGCYLQKDKARIGHWQPPSSGLVGVGERPSSPLLLEASDSLRSEVAIHAYASQTEVDI